jgi:hypothetical protein
MAAPKKSAPKRTAKVHDISKDLVRLAQPVAELKLLPGNPRRGNIDAVAKSLERFGQRKPVTVTADGTVTAGNHTLQAARQLGWTHIAVVTEDDDDRTAKAWALADNRIGDLGEYDDADLLAMIESVGDEDLLYDASYDAGIISDLLAGMEDRGSEDNYVRSIEPPVYEMKGEKPEVDDLTDIGYYQELVTEISASGVDEDVKEFLMAAAERHVKFNFSTIAEFYAHADGETQGLMERSGLVIIDFDKAIENGFIRLSERIADQFGVDYPEEV